MDEGPFRVSRPAARRAAPPSQPTRVDNGSSRPVQEQKIEQQPAAKEAPVDKKNSKNKLKKKPSLPLLAGLIFAGALIVGLVLWSFARGVDNGIDGDKYQAVFLTNGQHYFGKLQDVNDKYMKLTDIYYLQRSNSDESEPGSEDIQQSAGSQSNLELKKLGDEVHGPEDEMIISRDSILYYENLQAEGQATRAIEEYKKTSN